MTQTEITTIDHAVELHQKLIQAINGSKFSFLLIGKLLYELQQDDLYTSAIGNGADDWDDYIAMPEIALSRGEASRLSQIYEHFIERMGYDENRLAQIPIKNLHYLLPIAKNIFSRDELDPLVDDAENLSQKDFRLKLYENKHETDERTYTYLVMKRCNETNSISRVYGITSEDIVTKLNIE